MIIFQEHPPCHALAPYLACLWTCRVLSGAQPVSHRVLPDNCIDILWQDVGPGAHVAGMMSSAIQVAFTQPVRTIAVRFKPGAAAWFFDLPLHAMTDQHPALDALWAPGVAARFADALWARDQSDAQAMMALQTLLIELLGKHRHHAPHAGLAQAAVAALERSHGTLRIEALAASLGVSRQHLAQQFRIRIGLGAKTFARVCRLRAASARIRATPPAQLDWAELALACGYYDQSHLIHEFHQLAGSTPETFAAA